VRHGWGITLLAERVRKSGACSTCAGKDSTAVAQEHYRFLRGRGKKTMDEMEEGKQKFLEVVREADAAVQVVIPVTPSNSMFLISLTKGPNRKFITISEDDIIDLPNEASILAKVTKTVKDAIAAL
jgi:hypothetical protein